MLGSIALATFVAGASAHDIWVETLQSVVRSGQPVRVALLVGNHGNKHRDFKLASKLSPSMRKLELFEGTGAGKEITNLLQDQGLDAKEGYWSFQWKPEKEGSYLIASSFDQVMSFAPVRDIKSGKKFLRVVGSEKDAQRPTIGFDRVLGHGLELVPLTDPVLGAVEGQSFRVKVIHKGKPFAGNKVAFIPRGKVLQGDLDLQYEALTDSNGTVTMPLRESGEVLVVSQVHDREAKGEGYQSIGYSATIHLWVAAKRP